MQRDTWLEYKKAAKIRHGGYLQMLFSFVDGFVGVQSVLGYLD
jgi:hypothetical protein